MNTAPPRHRCRALGALALAGLCGCASPALIPTEVRFVSLKPGAEAVPLFDARPNQARASREEGRSQTLQFLGDDAMQPSPVALVASRIGAALPPAQRDRPIELRRLDIGFLVAPHALLPTGSNTSISVPSGTPLAALVAGVVLAYGMITAWNGHPADPSGVVYIEVRVGADSLRTAQTVAAGHDGAVQAVETAFAAALDDLADQARGLRSGAQAAP